jgi:hypothetical protein
MIDQKTEEDMTSEILVVGSLKNSTTDEQAITNAERKHSVIRQIQWVMKIKTHVQKDEKLKKIV